MSKLGPIFFIGVFISSLLIFFSPLSVQAKEAWEDKGLEWYYDNLSDEDRKKIRQAMDYAIPRPQIIDGYFMGYALPLATEIASNVVGYDPSIHIREYNLTKAKELLAEVFGKNYYENSSVVKANETITNTPYFKMNIIVPTTATATTNWASIVAPAFQDIGIEVEIKWLNSGFIKQRIFSDPSGVGLNHDYKGYDALINKISLFSDPYLANRYYPTNFVPEGENYQWIENKEVTEIVNHSLTDSSLINRLHALKSFQAWSYEWVPQSMIYQGMDIFLKNPNLIGFDPYNYGREPWVHNLSLLEGNTPYNFTSCVPNDIINFNPLLSTSWVDLIVNSNIHLSLTGHRGFFNITHPIGYVAKNWNCTPDGLEWTITLRQGLKFHDGTEVTAADVVFSYKAAMECPNSSWSEDMTSWFNSSNDFYEMDNHTVKFKLKQFHPYTLTQVFSVPILSKTQMGAINFVNWKTHETNTGVELLYGCGPYKFYGYDKSGNILCQKDITWNATLMGHNPSANGGGIWLNSTKGPDIYRIMVIKEAIEAIAAFKNDSVDFLDPTYNIVRRLINELETESCAEIVTYPTYSCWELGYNHYDPRWGLNPHDPCEMYPKEEESFLEIIYSSIMIFFGFIIHNIVLFIIWGSTILVIATLIYLGGNRARELKKESL